MCKFARTLSLSLVSSFVISLAAARPQSYAEDPPSIHDYERVAESQPDPASLPVLDGIVWYGTWESAMAEQSRTGQPVMLHMGSPRDRTTRVPGAW